MASVSPRANMPAHFGTRVVSAETDKVVGEIDADARHLNYRGIVHGQPQLVIPRAPKE